MAHDRTAIDTIRGYYYQFDFFINQVFQSSDMPLCSKLVETPLGEHVSCLEYEDERSRSMSDDRSCCTSLKNLASAMVSSCNVSIRNNAMPFFPHC